jgi:mannose-6-phosphate isomerase-like protein (cupin superfamily)
LPLAFQAFLMLISKAKKISIMNDKVNIKQKLSQFSDHWNPYIVGELNGQYVKLAKLKGEFVWHHHDNEDELFLVVKGTLKLAFRDKEVILNEGEFYIVPKGVEHKPIAEEEVELMLFEPIATLNTGNAGGEMTKEINNFLK